MSYMSNSALNNCLSISVACCKPSTVLCFALSFFLWGVFIWISYFTGSGSLMCVKQPLTLVNSWGRQGWPKVAPPVQCWVLRRMCDNDYSLSYPLYSHYSLYITCSQWYMCTAMFTRHTCHGLSKSTGHGCRIETALVSCVGDRGLEPKVKSNKLLIKLILIASFPCAWHYWDRAVISVKIMWLSVISDHGGGSLVP